MNFIKKHFHERGFLFGLKMGLIVAACAIVVLLVPRPVAIPIVVGLILLLIYFVKY